MTRQRDESSVLDRYDRAEDLDQTHIERIVFLQRTLHVAQRSICGHIRVSYRPRKSWN